MKTYKTVADVCYLCGIKEGEQYTFVSDEGKVASAARLVKIRRGFEKEKELFYTLCTRCILLTLIPPESEFFRFAFPEEQVKDVDETDKAHLAIEARIDATSKELEKTLMHNLKSMSEEIAKLKEDKKAEEPKTELEEPKKE